MNSSLWDDVQVFLPKYLTPRQARELFEELSSFPDIPDFYLAPASSQPDLLQGDAWRGFLAVNIESLQRHTVSGVVVSNSCDVDVSNARTLPGGILFAPLVRLNAYRDRLITAGKNQDRIDDHIEAIRAQRVTYIFHLPAGKYGPEEDLLLLLDDIHTQSLSHFAAGDRTLLFRLNQTAFYLFLLKLSIHFSRFQEDVQRFPLRDA